MKVATPRSNLSSDGSQMGRHWALPNVPIQPMNGMIRTYENQNRQFARPYSAKTVFFYKEGDEYFTGVRVPISKSRYRTIDSLLDDLNRNIQMPFGVRRLTTPMGRTPIESISQLEHLGKYVASSSRFSRGINLSALERLKKARFQAEFTLNRNASGGQSFWVPTSPSLTQQMRLHRHLGLGSVVTSKQIFFVLNGKGRFYRTLLNPLRLPSFEQLLAEVSEGLEVAIYRVYSSDGVRINTVPEMLNLVPPKLIACPRNERPTLREEVQLPSINPNRYAPKRMKTDSLTSAGSTENGIEKPRRLDTSFRRNTRKTTGAIKKRTSVLPPLPHPRKHVSSLPDEADSGKANSISSYGTSGKIDEDRHSSDYPEFEAMPSTYDENGRNPHKVSIHSDKTEDEVNERSLDSESPLYHDEEDMIMPSDSHPGTGRSRKTSKANKSREGTSRGKRRASQCSQKEDDLPSKPGTACSQGEHKLPSRQGTACSQKEDDLPSSKPGTSLSQREEILSSKPGTACSQKEDLLPSSKPGTSRSQREENLPSKPGTACSQREENLDSRNGSACSQRENELPSRLGTGESEPRKVHHDQDHYESESEFHRQKTVDSQEEKILPSDDEEPRKIDEHEAAVRIQAAYRGWNTRKQLRHVGFATGQNQIINPGELIEADRMSIDDGEEDELRASTPFEQTFDTQAFYTIGMTIGNRWGADTTTDLYIVLHGKDGVSERIPLTHEEIKWLQNPEPRFRQNQLDLFYVGSDPLGTLQKIVVGHEQIGYGAGTFIEHITVTENIPDGRQFLFVFRKWLDSGQVDGKIERASPLTALYFMDSTPGEDEESYGRWQFIVHNGTMQGEGGTTSNLLIYGYGTSGSSVVKVENDSTMKNVPDKTLIQVDFGRIGDLIKVRFEIDGAGERPDYYLDYVELMDMDTEEKILLRVEKWLKTSGEDKKWQSFREVAVFRPSASILSVITYDGKITAAKFDTKMEMLMDLKVMGELHGEWDSGIFPLFYNEKKKEFSFKVECVNMGAIRKLKLIGNFHEEGKAILEGMSVLQDIWDFYSPGISVADWLIGVTAYVRESLHCPYRYVLSQNKIVELEESQPYFKTLCLTGMEGLTTRNKKEEIPIGIGAWDLIMSVHGTKVPDVWIVQGGQEEHLSLEHFEDEILQFRVPKSKLDAIEKIRIDIGKLPPNSGFSIYKMKLRNTLTNMEMHFPALNTEFLPGQVLEFAAVLPDIPPKKTTYYMIKVRTHQVEGKVIPKIRMIGTDSNNGLRSLGDKPIIQGQEQFDFEGVNMGDLDSIEVIYEGDKKSLWTFDIIVSQMDSGHDFSTSPQTLKTVNSLTRYKLREL